MPYIETHVPAAILIDLGDGDIVYYTYKSDNANDPNIYLYTLVADSDDWFDVRELPQYDKQREKELTGPFAGNIALYDECMEVRRSYHAEVVKQAHEAGELIEE